MMQNAGLWGFFRIFFRINLINPKPIFLKQKQIFIKGTVWLCALYFCTALKMFGFIPETQHRVAGLGFSVDLYL